MKIKNDKKITKILLLDQEGRFFRIGRGSLFFGGCWAVLKSYSNFKVGSFMDFGSL